MSYLTTVSPLATSSASIATTSIPQRTAPSDPNRLFIGNLSPTVDEYTLIQVFSKCGKIAKMDYLFHKTGPLKGKPRGYAFVEYANKEDAQKAITKLHSRLLRGRNLVVHQASASPVYDQSRPYRKNDTNRTTTLSLLKKQGRPQSANAQIAALEAKIASMQNSPLQTSAPGSRDGSGSPGPHGEGEGRDDVEMEFGRGVDDLIREVQDGVASTGTGEMAGSESVERNAKPTTSSTTTRSTGPPVDKGKGKEKLHPSLPAKPPASTTTTTTNPGTLTQNRPGMSARGRDRTTMGR